MMENVLPPVLLHLTLMEMDVSPVKPDKSGMELNVLQNQSIQLTQLIQSTLLIQTGQ
jgi:hypothetical protein